LDADHPPARVITLDALDRPVVRARADSHRVAEPVDRLVMDGVHRERLHTENGREARHGVHLHAMHARVAFVVHVVRPDVLTFRGQVLYESSSEPDVHHLNPATDGECRHPELACARQQRELRFIARAVDRTEVRVRRRAVS